MSENATSSAYWRDVAERIIWTVVQVVVAGLIVAVADLDAWWVVPLTTVLVTVKTLVAKKVGDPDTAAIG